MQHVCIYVELQPKMFEAMVTYSFAQTMPN